MQPLHNFPQTPGVLADPLVHLAPQQAYSVGMEATPAQTLMMRPDGTMYQQVQVRLVQLARWSPVPPAVAACLASAFTVHLVLYTARLPVQGAHAETFDIIPDSVVLYHMPCFSTGCAHRCCMHLPAACMRSASTSSATCVQHHLITAPTPM